MLNIIVQLIFQSFSKMFDGVKLIRRKYISISEVISLSYTRNTKGGSITVPLTSCLTDLDWSVLQIKAKIVSCHKGDSGNTKGGSITVLLTSCLTGLDWSVLQIKTKIVSCYTADSKPVNQEVNSTVILPPLVFPA